MKIGFLTGGGDAPGLNGVLESAGRALLLAGHELVGIDDGFEGIFEDRTRNLTLEKIQGIHARAGTILGTSNKCSTEGREEEFLRKYQALGLDGMVVAGGDGTFAGLKAFGEQIPIIGVPKTIDNDLAGTEITFGFDTACSVVAQAVESLMVTAIAHRRAIVVEAMGRTAGWIALGGGLAGYANAILVPERPFDRDRFREFIVQKKEERRGIVVVVSEGTYAQGESPQVKFVVSSSPQPERYGGVAQSLARWIEKETGWESRDVVLGHLQRSHAPTTTDRFLTLAMGVEASRMVQERAWGKAVVYRDGRILRAPVSDLMAPARRIPPVHRWVQLAQALGIFV